MFLIFLLVFFVLNVQLVKNETVHHLIILIWIYVCCRYQIPEDWPYQEARRLFKEPNVTLDVPELKWTAPDEEVCLLSLLTYLKTPLIHRECIPMLLAYFQGLISFLVKDNGFNEDRVTKVHLFSFGSYYSVLQSFFLSFFLQLFLYFV